MRLIDNVRNIKIEPDALKNNATSTLWGGQIMQPDCLKKRKNASNGLRAMSFAGGYLRVPHAY